MNDMEVNERKTVGEVFSIGKDNPPIPGCTVSKAFGGEDSGITYFPWRSIPTSARKFILTISY